MRQAWRGIACVLSLGLGVSVALADPQDKEKGSETMAAELPACPVSGKPINFAVSTPTDDGPLFFCCQACVPKYVANPDKYASQVAVQREALSGRPKIQVTCPVSGEPVDTKVFLEQDGKNVYFCCNGCISKYQADPRKYAAALANSYTYQVKCPVTGEEIDPQSFTEVASGHRIYFCCDSCKPKFDATPEKYLTRLGAQGFRFDKKEMKLGETAPQGADQAHGHAEQGHQHGMHDGGAATDARGMGN
jgi:YHS domain-containing protein